MKFLQQTGAATIAKVAAIGRAGIMLSGALFAAPKVKNISLTIRQLYVVGVQSLLIILVSGLFIGMVMALQGYTILVGTIQATAASDAVPGVFDKPTHAGAHCAKRSRRSTSLV